MKDLMVDWPPIGLIAAVLLIVVLLLTACPLRYEPYPNFDPYEVRHDRE